ncbi:hypothetical protein TWF191_003637 [Orbilia oligospora]|uniref:Uncharacterized protein n=1 Tax=Orbilia oligospora TaxID=2813651 RepID=A0A7C8QY08_ORBOL|nr:hypothetical protein TWF191_003637 [Orbilia oligospora]
MSPPSSSSSRSPPSKSKSPRPKKTPLTILLSYTATAFSLRSQIETDLTTIRKRIRRAKYHNIPQTNLLAIIASIKQLADIYATTAMAYVTASNTAELYAISASALEKLMRVEEELKKFDNINLDGDDDDDYSGTQRPDCENPYAETIEGRFELMGVPDLGGRRRERYNVFQTGSAGLGSDVRVKSVQVKKPEAVEINRGAETEKPVRPVYGTVKITPANGRPVKRRPENQ